VGVGDLKPRAAVFLDRDGTLNRAFVRDGVSHPPMLTSELEILPGVEDGLDLLSREGFALIVVTNQPDVARGALPMQMAEEINALVRARLPLIDALLCCYHDDVHACDCRKPKPGMLLRAAEQFQLDLRRSFMIGDSWRDTAAGRQAGCFTIELEGAPSRPHSASAPDQWAQSLLDACSFVASSELARQFGDA
jgi:D-glycero-D-manno-heptose 1,7-bisphosphate phosphatase